MHEFIEMNDLYHMSHCSLLSRHPICDILENRARMSCDCRKYDDQHGSLAHAQNPSYTSLHCTDSVLLNLLILERVFYYRWHIHRQSLMCTLLIIHYIALSVLFCGS